jgi:hypothetical protein
MSDNNQPNKCALCGEPMPPGEQMFKFHGYSGPCPKPPLQKPIPTNPQEELDDLYKTLDDELEHNVKRFEIEQRPRIEKAKALMGDFYSPGEHYVDALLRYVEHLKGTNP